VSLPKNIVLIAENEPQDIKLIHSPEQNGYGLDCVWNDDFHHSAMVALNGRREGYYTDYRGVGQEFISMIKRGYLYQGQAYSWQNKSRGTIVSNEPAWSFIFYLQNHDQIANELRGERIHNLIDPGLYRALTALLLLGPQTPLLFMGQEFASSSRFMFFADHTSEDLIKNVSEGRRKSLEKFPSYWSAYQSAEAQKFIPDTCSEASFQNSKVDLSERRKNKEIYQLHLDLIKIRQTDQVIAAQDRFNIDGAVLDQYSFVLRYFGIEGDDRLLLINLERDLEYYPLAEPLLAPSKKGFWELIWSSDNPSYGGPGIINPCQDKGWRLPSHSAILLKSVAEEEKPKVEKHIKETDFNKKIN
jgi:maltooligosyltrehalose trehalohydrolase